MTIILKEEKCQECGKKTKRLLIPIPCLKCKGKECLRCHFKHISRKITIKVLLNGQCYTCKKNTRFIFGTLDCEECFFANKKINGCACYLEDPNCSSCGNLVDEVKHYCEECYKAKYGQDKEDKEREEFNKVEPETGLKKGERKYTQSERLLNMNSLGKIAVGALILIITVSVIIGLIAWWKKKQ